MSTALASLGCGNPTALASFGRGNPTAVADLEDAHLVAAGSRHRHADDARR